MTAMTTRAPKQQVEFERIKRTEVPFWHPVSTPVTERTGSQWDDALDFLSSDPDSAIRLNEPSKKRRDRLKSTLQTIAKNRGLRIKVRNQNELVYAWSTEEIGRFSRPTEAKESTLIRI